MSARPTEESVEPFLLADRTLRGMSASELGKEEEQTELIGQVKFTRSLKGQDSQLAAPSHRSVGY